MDGKNGWPSIRQLPDLIQHMSMDKNVRLGNLARLDALAGVPMQRTQASTCERVNRSLSPTTCPSPSSPCGYLGSFTYAVTT